MKMERLFSQVQQLSLLHFSKQLNYNKMEIFMKGEGIGFTLWLLGIAIGAREARQPELLYHCMWLIIDEETRWRRRRGV